MKQKMGTYFYAILFLASVFAITACASSDSDDVFQDDTPSVSTNPQGNSNNPSNGPSDDLPAGTEGKTNAIIAALQGQGFQILRKVVINGDVGILAELSERPDKRCIVLTGKPYSLGYQMGNLLPSGTYNMARVYTENLLQEYAYVKKGTFLFNYIKNMATSLAKSAVYEENAIPEYLIDEMEGVVDGANVKNDAGHQITFDDVLVLNEGLDTLYSMLFTHKLPKTQGATKDILGCNGFVVSGNATVGGKVYHGRDFMLATGDVYQDEALMTIYIPDKGKPFVTLGAPGFVGQTTGINSDGLSMGVDVVFGEATRETPGMGCLFVIRDIVQNCSNIDEGVSRMKSQNRGVAWIYTIADNDRSLKYTNGAVIEEGMSYDSDGKEFNGPDILPKLMQLSMKDLIEKLPEEVPEKGVITRTQDWAYPEEFKGLEDFPPQIEASDDVVVVANHYIHPRMVFTTFSNWMQLLQTNYWKTSRTLARYEDLTKRIMDNYGAIDFKAARDLIDFMNPNRYYEIDYSLPKPPEEETRMVKNSGYDAAVIEGYEPWNRYRVYDKEIGNEPWNGPVEGHHDIFDNSDLIMECLYGYYRTDEPWVRVDLKPFVEIALQ